MKKILIAIAFLSALFLIVNVSASGFSPTSLIFNLSPNEQSCQKITITSDSSKIIIEDKWAENKDVEWQTTKFNEYASYHGISINYPLELSDERVFEVCVSGSDTGEYHGVILIKEEQVGNSIIQMGVWVKLIVSDETSASTLTSTSSETQTSSGTSAGTGTSTTTTDTEQQAQETETQKTTTELESQNSPLTGAATGGESKLTNIVIYFIAGLLIAGMLVFIIKSWRKKRWERGL